MRRDDRDKKLDKIIQDVKFIPSSSQRQVKASYLIAVEDNPIVGDNPTATAISRLTGDTRVIRWWSTPGFREWFTNRDEFRQKMEHLADVALDALGEILMDEEANASAKVAAAKLALSAAGKMPSAGDGGKFADERIQEMNKKELEAFIMKSQAIQIESSDTEGDSN